MEDIEKIISKTAYPDSLNELSDEVEDEEDDTPKQFFKLFFTVKGQIVVAATSYNEAVEMALECVDDSVSDLNNQENIIISKKLITEKEV